MTETNPPNPEKTSAWEQAVDERGERQAFLVRDFGKHIIYVINRYYKKLGDNSEDTVNMAFLAIAADCLKAYQDPETRLKLLTEFCAIVCPPKAEEPNPEPEAT